jgi:hypothetical protein
MIEANNISLMHHSRILLIPRITHISILFILFRIAYAEWVWGMKKRNDKWVWKKEVVEWCETNRTHYGDNSALWKKEWNCWFEKMNEDILDWMDMQIEI